MRLLGITRWDTENFIWTGMVCLAAAVLLFGLVTMAGFSRPAGQENPFPPVAAIKVSSPASESGDGARPAQTSVRDTKSSAAQAGLHQVARRGPNP